MRGKHTKALGGLALFAVLSGCSQTAAPVINFEPVQTAPSPPSQYTDYTVQSGDSLSGIAAQNHLPYPTLAELNNIAPPYNIYIGQVLKIPNPEFLKMEITSQATQYGGEIQPLEKTNPIPAQNLSFAQITPASAPISLPSVSTGSSIKTAGLIWSWPVSGQITTSFGDGGGVFANGIGITTQANAKVLAATDGIVTFSGTGVNGYGDMVILKSENNFLTAYTNLSSLLVKKGQTISRTTPIGVVGMINAKPILHFELRQFGNPVDPIKYMPPAGS